MLGAIEHGGLFRRHRWILRVLHAELYLGHFLMNAFFGSLDENGLGRDSAMLNQQGAQHR